MEIELHREIYHFTHERQTLKLDSNQHSAISRSFYHLNYLSDEVPVTLAKLSDVTTYKIIQALYAIVVKIAKYYTDTVS